MDKRVGLGVWGSLALASTLAAGDYQSHPPVRSLPAPSSRPLAAGRSLFVDAGKGSDANDGSLGAPWKTLAHAFTNLAPGATLCLRGGVYYEHGVLSGLTASAEAPITVRAYPGELAVIDGGIRDFFEQPAEAWEPVPGSETGEFRSKREFPDGGPSGNVNVMGNFGDSWLPLHGYRFYNDFTNTSSLWQVTRAKNTEDEGNVYCGPGVIYRPETRRIHIRLAHTTYAGWGAKNYAGETDPRKLSLVIALGREPALRVARCKYVRLQDLVVRGAVSRTLFMEECEDVELDGMTLYGGSTPMGVKGTARLRVVNSGFRGIAGPWSTRSTMKYRGVESQLFSASAWEGFTGNRDFELAHCEFTDSCDGLFIGNVQHMEFHHNLLDNCSDDGIFVTATTGPDGQIQGGGHRIYQNVISRTLTGLSFGTGHGTQKEMENGKKQTGAGLYAYRNVFDLREPVHYGHPSTDEEARAYAPAGRVCGDHGSPAWEPMWIYQNTIVMREAPWRANYLGGFINGTHAGAPRRLFNNILVQLTGQPGTVFPSVYTDFEADGNLQWSLTNGWTNAAAYAAAVRKSAAASAAMAPPAPKDKTAAPTASDLGLDRPKGDAGKELDAVLAPAPPPKPAAPAWGGHDLYADPAVVALSPDWVSKADFRLRPGSPAIDAGVPLPREWPDVKGLADAGVPDIGAFPAGCEPWKVGAGK